MTYKISDDPKVNTLNKYNKLDVNFEILPVALKLSLFKLDVPR